MLIIADDVDEGDGEKDEDGGEESLPMMTGVWAELSTMSETKFWICLWLWRV